MADLSAASFIMGLGQNAASKALELFITKTLDATAEKMVTEQSLLADKIRSMIQSNMELVKEKINSQSESRLSTSRQLILETFIDREYKKIGSESKIGFDHNNIGLYDNQYIGIVPTDRHWMLREAEIKAKEVFHDKKNCSPLLTVEALKIQLFCQTLLYHDDPRRCISLIVSHIKSIGRDSIMIGVLKEISSPDIQFIGKGDRIRLGIIQLYQHIRLGLCHFGSRWYDQANIQRAIDALHELHPDANFQKTKKRLGVDGMILSTFCRDRAVILTVGTSLYHSKNQENVLIVFNCQHGRALKIDLNNLNTEVMKSVNNPFIYFKRKINSAISGESSSTNMMRNAINNFQIAGTSCCNERDLTKVQEELTTDKKHFISKTDNGLSIKWFVDAGDNNENISLYDLSEFVNKQLQASGIEPVAKELITTKIVLITAQDGPQTDTVYISLEVKIKEMEQRFWRIICRKSGGMITQKLFKLRLPEPHSVCWSQKNNCFEAILRNKDKPSIVTVAQVSKHKIMSKIKNNRLTKSIEFNFIPKSISDNIPRRQANALYSFNINQFFMSDKFIFLALDVKPGETA